MRKKKNVLIIKFGGLGDLILSLRAIYSIKKKHSSSIVVLTEKPFDEFFTKSKWFDEVITIKRGLFYFSDKIQIGNKINLKSFEYVYDLQTSNRSSSYLSLFNKKKVRISGIGEFASIPHKNPKRNRMHTIERQEEQLKECGIKLSPKLDLKWLFQSRIPIPKKKFALIVPGGAKKRPNKRIPPEIYETLIQKLIKKKISPMLIGSSSDELICKFLERKFTGIKNLCSKTTIFDIAKLSMYCQISIGNDTGPMHIISLGRKPSFVLFTKNSNPRLCAPLGKNVKIFNYHKTKKKQILTDLNYEIVKC